MNLPFTPAEFLSVFARYNAQIWPLQPLAFALALAAAVLVATRSARLSGRATTALLTGFWAVSGIGYHLLSFSRLSPAAYLFGAGFVLQTALFAVAAARGSVTFAPPRGWRGLAGGLVLLYALFGYPVLGWLSGRGALSSPYLGVAPCPTTIFTLGLLLWSNAPRRLYVLPILWALIGTTAALRLGIHEDLGMTVSALVAAASLVHRRTGAEAPAAA